LATVDNVCGINMFDATDGFSYSAPEALRTLTNSSSQNKVVFTDDQTAILAPFDSPGDASYVAPTVGVNSACQSITHQCVYNNSGYWGGGSGPFWNCTGQPLLNISWYEAALAVAGPATDLRPFGVVNTTNGMIADGEWPNNTANFQVVESNPFPLAAIVMSEAYTNGPSSMMDITDPTWLNDTGFFLMEGAWNVIYCNVTVRNITYSYDSPFPAGGDGVYKTLSWEPASLRITSLLTAYLDSTYISSFVPQNVEGSGLHFGMNYVDAFGLELSRELVAFSASIWQPENVLSISGTKSEQGTRLQIIPLALYVVTVLLYSAVTLIVAVTAIIATHSISYVGLAQTRITSPTVLIYQLFGPVESSRTWKESGVDLFAVESETDRLDIGAYKIAQGELAFGVSKTKAD